MTIAMRAGWRGVVEAVEPLWGLDCPQAPGLGYMNGIGVVAGREMAGAPVVRGRRVRGGAGTGTGTGLSGEGGEERVSLDSESEGDTESGSDEDEDDDGVLAAAGVLEAHGSVLLRSALDCPEEEQRWV